MTKTAAPKPPRALRSFPPITEGLANRFWAKVDWSAGFDECWPWTGAVYGDGRRNYGAFGWHHGHVLYASRAALYLSGGDPPEPNMIALHDCDRPICCNPGHLHWGSWADNMQEMDDRGRRRVWHPAAERNPKSKINWSIVRAIRSSPDHPGQLAEQYGLTIGHIFKIKRGAAWPE